MKFAMALLVVFNLFSNVQADDWEDIKGSLNMAGLSTDIFDATKFDILKKQNELSQQVKMYVEGIGILEEDIARLDLKINQYKQPSKLANSLKNPSSSTLKAFIKTMKTNAAPLIDQVNVKIAGQEKLNLKIQELEGQKLKIANDLDDIKISKSMKTLTTLKYLGYAATVVDIGVDASKINERIAQGSTGWLEAANLLLKGVEAFQPTIPFTKTPSDVGREIINYQAALKSRNASLVQGNEIANNSTIEFLNGGASIEAYMFRKLQERNANFNVNNFEQDVNEAYKSIRKDYMENHFSVFLKNLYETKEMLAKEKDNAWGWTDSKAMFQSLINGIDLNIKSLLDESSKIWNQDKGLNPVIDFASVSVIKNLAEQNKKIAVLSIEIDQLQAKQAKELAEQAKKLEAALKNADAIAKNSNESKEGTSSASCSLGSYQSIIQQGSSSAIGSPSAYMGCQNLSKTAKNNIDPVNPNNNQIQVTTQPHTTPLPVSTTKPSETIVALPITSGTAVTAPVAVSVTPPDTTGGTSIKALPTARPLP